MSRENSEFWWNTSEGLRTRMDPIAPKGEAAWSKFADTYDQEEYQEARRRAFDRERGIFNKLRNLSRIAQTTSFYERLFSMDEMTPEEAVSALAREMLPILDDISLKKLEQLLKEARRFSQPTDETKRIRNTISALRAFVERERRLPGKTELNMEANRFKRSVWINTAWRSEDYQFGELRTFEERELYIYTTLPRLRGCPKNQWDKCLFDQGNASRTFLTESGLADLPRTSRSKS